MTCIVGMRTKTGVLLGGDTQGTSNRDAVDRLDPKVFGLGRDMAVGFTSSYRMGQIIRFNLEPPTCPAGHDAYPWVVREFIPAIRDVFKEHGYQHVLNERATGGTFLLAVGNRLFKVGDDFQVAERADPFDACGAGEDYALGALHALGRYEMSPHERLTEALNAANRFNVTVGDRYTFVETKR